TLLKSGVPIIRALSGLEQSAANPTLRSTVVEVREGLESGRELSQALRQHPKVFPPYMVSLVRVGEVTGRLDEVFMRLYEFFAFSAKSGVPIVQVLSIVAEVVDNAYLEARIAQMRDSIERGESILRAAVATGVFSPVVLQMVAVGEETGEIDQLMSEIADMYEREVTIEVQGLTAKVEPILLVCMGVLVLILALGVFLPMWDMAGAARGGGGGAR